jgi:hypothetical protein
VFSGFCCAVVLVIWFRGVLGVAPGVWLFWLVFFCLWWFWCVVSGPLFGGWLLRAGVCCFWLLFCFCLCWFCFVLGCPLFCGPPGVAPVVFRAWLLFWLVVVVVLLCPLFCSWWCCGCSAVLVAGLFLLLVVSPVRCSWLLVAGASGSFGGSWFGCFSPPLFHDLGCPGPGFVLIAECHLVGVAVCGFVLFWFSACCFVLLLFFGLSRVSSSVSSRLVLRVLWFVVSFFRVLPLVSLLVCGACFVLLLLLLAC